MAMHHLGTRTLETERMILRRFMVEDGEAMFRNWAGNENVTRYLTWPTHESSAVSMAMTALWAGEADREDRYQWAIVLKTLGEPIGTIAVMSCNEVVCSAEVGYCIGEPWWGQSLVAEALRAVIGYLVGDVGMKRIFASHDVENKQSGRVMEKAGMHFEGIARASGHNNQGIVDLATYAILADEVPKAWINHMG